jgi:hypothetical protein
MKTIRIEYKIIMLYNLNAKNKFSMILKLPAKTTEKTYPLKTSEIINRFSNLIFTIP